ncbi:T9SS-dependent choice-of-anchor J family protein [Adhaeribacter soli]|uniref:T9SS type A sorting domain-containing protein n=1 Tax=Adhaeribacter soli TaxID=2607655 RepID=A0A5N1IKT9_9BACT|nr:choice-of-anchor J domain-containing protein [Adhaeribacter soli]KAA9327304.1 T9SS type A sorting domain-containing protein [Adhaeribacter soli]
MHKFTFSPIVRTVLLVSFLSFLSASAIQAQFVSDYQFSASNGNYTSLGGSASVVSFTTNPLIKPVPLGFTFNFAGTNYTDVYACLHGFLSFNSNAVHSSQNNLQSGGQGAGVITSRPLLAPLWDALDVGLPNSRTAYQTTGPPGAQIFTFEWENMEWDFFRSIPVISFQVKLYEGTNKIEFLYRREANAPLGGSASIGIVGPAIGSGNFLSLNNTGPNPAVSYTTETDTLSTWPATGQIYTFTPPPVLPVDVRITGLSTPPPSGCFGTSEPVRFNLKNNGSNPLNLAATPVTVQAVVRGPNPLVFPPVLVNTGTLAPGSSQVVSVANNYNMSAAGSYTFNATATIAGDGNTANDSLIVAISRQVPPNVALPQNLNFTGFNAFNLGSLYPGWSEAGGNKRQTSGSDWSFASDLGTAGNTTGVFRFRRSSKNHHWLISPKFTVSSGTVLRFKTAITSLSGNNVAVPSIAGTDDSVRIMISTDCGLSFNEIYSFNASSAAGLTNVLTDQQINLSAYAGQNIILAFYATDGSVINNYDYTFHLDDIFIGILPVTDLGVIALQSPVPKKCYSGAENVVLTIKNYGANLLDFNTNPVQVQVTVTGPNLPNTLTATINSGTLMPWASQNVTVSPTLNMQAAGVYNFIASASVAGDNIPVNDTIKATRQTSAVYPLPQSSDFSGYVSTGGNSNLSTIFPGWYEATGAIFPGLRVNGWRNKNLLGPSGNISAYIPLTSNFRNEWLVSPKIVPLATTVFGFKAAITEITGNRPTMYAGMANTDNKVQVMVSTDCGISFNPIYTFDASNTAGLSNTLTPFTFPLGQYAGQEIIVALFATDGLINNPNKFDFNVDDIFIGSPPPADLGVTALVTPLTTGCYTNAEGVKVTVQNFHASQIDFGLHNATVTVEVSGASNATFSAVLNSGTLAGGASQTVVLTPGLNMVPAGTYQFKAYITIAGDNIPTNDTTNAIRIRYPVVSGPSAVDFTGYNGTNLSTVFPEWREAYGQVPVVAPAPYWGAATGLGSSGNATAELYLHDTWQRDWLIGPKFTATASSQLMFDAAITNWGTQNPAPLGMAGTDDSVQVLVSTDCGKTYRLIYSFNATTVGSLTNVLTPYSFSLGAYAGQEIMIAFFGTGGTIADAVSYGFHLDNISISYPTGIKEAQVVKGISVFPNPSQGNFEVKVKGFAENVTAQLFTLTGQPIKTRQSRRNKQGVLIESTGLAPGVYLLRVVLEENVQVMKVIIQ